jgi:hypothetical protein
MDVGSNLGGGPGGGGSSSKVSNPSPPMHSDFRTVSPYWVLPVYVEFIREVGQTMGQGYYYFDEKRSSFNLVQNQLFALKKLNIY